MTTASTDNLTKPEPITCQPWCVYGDGHPNEIMAEDQTCRGPVGMLLLTLESQLGSDWDPVCLTTYPEKFYGQEPAIFLGKGESSGVHLTVNEACRFADALLSIAEAIIVGQS